MDQQKATLAGGIEFQISGAGSELVVTQGAEVFRLKAPPHARFYTFAEHYAAGICPIVSFEPGHQINGWQDWHYRVNMKTKSMERVDPWK